MASYSDRNTSIIPNLTFSFVESYIKANKFSSGDKSINKGYKFYSEGYIHNLKVAPTQAGCIVTGRRHRSQRKNEEPYNLELQLSEDSNGPAVTKVQCGCAIALNACCGHVTGLLYQLANFKMLDLKALPEDVAKTSLPQTFHVPRGQKIGGKAVQEIEVCGYKKIQEPGSREDAEPRTVKSTLDAVGGETTDWVSKKESLASVQSNLLILPALNQPQFPSVPSKFEPVHFGSILNYQQSLESGHVMNIVDGVGFPQFPFDNYMTNNYSVVLKHDQEVKLKGLCLSHSDVNKFEEKTRLQSQNPLWFKIRKHRVTASQTGCKRWKDEEGLARQLKSCRRVFTAAMRQGIASEPTAASKYATIKDDKVNLYPCGVVVSPWSPWIAASPDRKVYLPSRNPPFGLLEIKCPQVSSVLEASCLKKDATGSLELKKNRDYYYQVLTQLAVTGLEWCDFMVWCVNDYHIETIYFNKDIWDKVKNKIDMFFFDFFI